MWKQHKMTRKVQYTIRTQNESIQEKINSKLFHANITLFEPLSAWLDLCKVLALPGSIRRMVKSCNFWIWTSLCPPCDHKTWHRCLGITKSRLTAIRPFTIKRNRNNFSGRLDVFYMYLLSFVVEKFDVLKTGSWIDIGTVAMTLVIKGPNDILTYPPNN